VPHVLLLDTKGRIVFKGHPATRKDLEADFDTLLKGEPLTGEGAWVEGAAGPGADDEAKEEEDDEGFKNDLDAETVHKEVQEFKTTVERLIADTDLMEKAKGMMRNFCVITVEEKYDAQNDKMKIRYQNHRVIVGPEKQVETFKEAFAKEIKGSFELKE